MLTFKSHFSLPYLGVGRVRIMLDGLHARAAEKGIAPIAERVEAIMPIHAEWHRLWAGWQAQKDQRADGDARRLDIELDKVVRAIHRNIVDLADAPFGDALGDEARRVIDLHFPHGLPGVTQVLYEEQALKCQALLDHLRADPDRTGWVRREHDMMACSVAVGETRCRGG